MLHLSTGSGAVFTTREGLKSGSKQETAPSHDVSDEKNKQTKKLLASKIAKWGVHHSVLLLKLNIMRIV